ncbi:hypothetical protein BH10CHL1_BH10CHL1_28340 [soil metagenome]
MVNLSSEEKSTLLAGKESDFIFLGVQQTDLAYQAGGRLILTSVLESLRAKKLVAKDGENYKLTEAGRKEVKQMM